MKNVAVSSTAGPTTSSSTATPSAAVPPASANCVSRITRRRSTMSASEPATRPNTTEGRVLAVCTSATVSAEGVSVAISHAATVACIV